MTTLKTRNRLVSFRLTGEELENLRVACLLKGARNVSEFARGAVLELAAARASKDAQLVDRLWAVELRLTEIESGLRGNAEMLQTMLKNLVNAPAEGKDGEKQKAKGA